LPARLSITPQGPDPTLSIDGGQWTADGSELVVPVNIDTARPQGSTGMTDAILALRFDPSAFTVSAADIQLGTVPGTGSGWQLKADVNEQTGMIGAELYSNTSIQSFAGGGLVTVILHALSEPRASESGSTVSPPLTIVPFVDPTSGPRVYQTAVSDGQVQFVLEEVNGGRWTVDGEAKLTSSAANPAAVPPVATGHASDSALRTSHLALPASALAVEIIERVFGDSVPLVSCWHLIFDDAQAVETSKWSGDFALLATVPEPSRAGLSTEDQPIDDPEGSFRPIPAALEI
jgi:hypothetical protein